MKLKDGAYDTYMKYDSAARTYAESWAQFIETAVESGMAIRTAIAFAHNLITYGTDLSLAALVLLINNWVYGEHMQDWYSKFNLLINI